MTTISSLTLQPIGIVRSPLKQAAGSPIQPSSASGVEGSIELDPSYEIALRDLGGFSRIWVVYWFHRAAAVKLVVTPYRDTREHGVLATRAPARPNPIGLSSLALLGIQANVLKVGDCDILDGTPVLDIKPYIPEYDSYTSLRLGWMETAARLDVHTGDARFEATNPVPGAPPRDKA